MIASLLAVHRPILMGILNLTPDSFSGDGKVAVASQLKRAEQLISDGANILDVGGESTRPKALLVGVSEEIRRVVPFLEAFRQSYPTFPISLDTTKPEVARVVAKDYAIQMINDVSFLRNPELATIAANHQLGYVLMHARGTPETMDGLCDYPDGIVAGVVSEFKQKIAELSDKLSLQHLILDPGLGFAKTAAQSATLYEQLGALQVFSLPVLLGLSRKRFLTHLGAPTYPIEARDAQSAEFSVKAALAGSAQIIRVHNVALAKKILTDGKREG